MGNCNKIKILLCSTVVLFRLQYKFGLCAVFYLYVDRVEERCEDKKGHFLPRLAELIKGRDYCKTHVIEGRDGQPQFDKITANDMISKLLLA